jgi:hypothetical protein
MQAWIDYADALFDDRSRTEGAARIIGLVRLRIDENKE